MNIAQSLASKGRGGDSIVAHINPKEAMILKALGGSGTRNPKTGLLEFEAGDDYYGDMIGMIAPPPGGWVPTPTPTPTPTTPVQTPAPAPTPQPTAPVYYDPIYNAPEEAAPSPAYTPAPPPVYVPPPTPVYTPPAPTQAPTATSTPAYVATPSSPVGVLGGITSSPEAMDPTTPQAFQATANEDGTYKIGWNTDVGPVYTNDASFLTPGGSGLKAGDKIPTALVPAESGKADTYQYVYPDGTKGDEFEYETDKGFMSTYFPAIVKGFIQAAASTGGPIAGGAMGALLSAMDSPNGDLDFSKIGTGALSGAIGGYLAGGSSAVGSASNLSNAGGYVGSISNAAANMAPATSAAVTGATTAGAAKLGGADWSDALQAGLISGAFKYIGGKLIDTSTGQEVNDLTGSKGQFTGVSDYGDYAGQSMFTDPLTEPSGHYSFLDPNGDLSMASRYDLINKWNPAGSPVFSSNIDPLLPNFNPSDVIGNSVYGPNDLSTIAGQAQMYADSPLMQRAINTGEITDPMQFYIDNFARFSNDPDMDYVDKSMKWQDYLAGRLPPSDYFKMDPILAATNGLDPNDNTHQYLNGPFDTFRVDPTVLPLDEYDPTGIEAKWTPDNYTSPPASQDIDWQSILKVAGILAGGSGGSGTSGGGGGEFPVGAPSTDASGSGGYAYTGNEGSSGQGTGGAGQNAELARISKILASQAIKDRIKGYSGQLYYV